MTIAVRNSIEPLAAARLNVADRLQAVASILPDAIAVACPRGASRRGRFQRRQVSGSCYSTITFADLDSAATKIAKGLEAWGVPQGSRLALLVPPGIEFVALVFGLLRAGMVIVLVDPGLGRRNLLRCVQESEPKGFVAIGAAQVARILWNRKFPNAQWNVTVGRRWFWGGLTLDRLIELGDEANRAGAGLNRLEKTRPDDGAAIVFTSGSTGPPKGVFYTHLMFDTQVEAIRSMYGIEPSGVDLSCFPLFALFNSAMGVTTVFPEMDFSRPASANPKKIIAAANDWKVTQAFASPAVWRNVGNHCARAGERMPTLRKVFSCGAPVPANVLRETLACAGEGAKMHTPYGATECLPVATIEAHEVLTETSERTDHGAGVCVGRKFDSIDWRIIRITDQPIAAISGAEKLPTGEVGELIVRGPQVSARYVTRVEANLEAKIQDDAAVRHSTELAGDHPKRDRADWHRTGDVGYLDDDGRFWYCGRKSQRVETLAGTMYTESCEALFNKHPLVRRSALVGVGPRGNQTPVMILETLRPLSAEQQGELQQLLRDDRLSASDGVILFVDWPLPVDIRHNSKINREWLATWAAKQLQRRAPKSSAPHS